jgi:hypothetical protein
MAHGISIIENPTPGTAIRPTEAVVPFVVGVAPIQHLAVADRVGKTNRPIVIRSLPEFYTKFGIHPFVDEPTMNQDRAQIENLYSLTAFAKVYFGQYGASPVVFVNTFECDAAIVPNDFIGQDWDFVAEEAWWMTNVQDPLFITGSPIDTLVGTDDGNGNRTGLQLISEVYPLTGLVPNAVSLLGNWNNASVSAEDLVLVALPRIKDINGVGGFKAVLFADYGDMIGSDTVKYYPYFDANTPSLLDAGTIINAKTPFSDPHLVICGDGLIDDAQLVPERLSVHLLGIMANLAADNGDVPYISPSNKTLRSTKTPTKVHTEQEWELLNGAGIVTFHRLATRFVPWGNTTSAYPEILDLKDRFIANRFFANWLENTIYVLLLPFVDQPINRNLVETVITRLDLMLSGLRAGEALLGANVSFLPEDNPAVDLQQGIIRLRIDYLSPPPAENIQVSFTVNLTYFNALFN